MKGALIFLAVLLSILALVWGYTSYSLLFLPPWSNAVRTAGMSVLALLFLLQVARWVLFERSSDSVVFSWIAYFSLGLMAHLFLGSLLKDLLLVASWAADYHLLPPDQLQKVAAASTLGICLLLNAMGTHTALQGPIIKRVRLRIDPTLRIGLGEPFRIVQISDLHVGPIIKKPYVEKVVEAVNSLQPDLIAVTGDLGDGLVDQLKKDLEPLRLLKASHGVYYVPGNHEYYWRIQDWLEKVTELGMIPLMNSGREVKNSKLRLWIGGVSDPTAERMTPASQPNGELAAPPNESAQSFYKILLAHQPKSYPEGLKGGFDLMLNGHTHNGQFFPFNLIVGLFNPFDKGLHKENGMDVYVNSGTGFWGPPLRLGVPSEITLLELE